MLLLVAIIVVAVVWLEGGRPEGDLLDQMARRSLPWSRPWQRQAHRGRVLRGLV